MSWSSADEIAERASAEYRDTRTPQQRKFDDLALSIADHIAHLRGMTYPDGASWARDGKALDRVMDRLRDALREARALSIEGYREGDELRSIPTLEPITRTVARLSSPEVA